MPGKMTYCDPAFCNNCQYIGDGDFLCDRFMEIVVMDWEPPDKFLICGMPRKKRRKKHGKKKSRK